jgi:hypothetical protein
MLFAVLSAGIAFLQAAQGNDRPNQPDNQNYSSSKKHKT